MIDNSTKIEKFAEAISAYAEQQSRKIHEEVELFKAERLQQAEEQVILETAELIRREGEEVNDRLKQELSQRDFDRKGALIRRRQELAESVFAEARQQLTAFTRTAEYADWLKKSMTAMQQVLPEEGTVYYLAAQDEKQVAGLKEGFPACTFALADDIAIGGIRGMNHETGLLADDTLDTRLDQQQDWFIQNVGLSVKPV